MATNNATNSSIVGTSNQITVSSPTGTSTLSIPSALTVPGSITITTFAQLTECTSSSIGVIRSVNRNGSASAQNVPLIHTYGDNTGNGYNFFAGQVAGNFTLTVGTARFNTAVGAGGADDANHLIGVLGSLTTGNGNTFIGVDGGNLITTGTGNGGIGVQSLYKLLTGADNFAVSTGSITGGSAYTGSESANIVICNAGVAAESHAIRIGTQGSGSGQQNTCYIAGITGVSVSNLNLVTINTSTGQLGSQAISSGLVTSITGTANQITASASTGAVTLSLPSAITTPGSLTATTTLTATSGAITATSGDVVITSGNLTLPTTSASVGQIVVNGTPWAHSSGTTSTFVGSGSGNFTQSGNGIACFGGLSGAAITTATHGTYIGFNAGNSITTANDCTAIGRSALAANISSNNNTAVGSSAGAALTTTSPSNTLIGFSSGLALTTGSSDNVFIGKESANGTNTGVLRNVVIGSTAASGWTGSETDNIIIGYGIAGTAAQTNTIRIGAQGTGSGQQNSCFIAGITGVTVTGTAVLCSTTGLLGTVVSSRRYKDNIQDMDETSILSLRPVTFFMKKETLRENQEPCKQYGLIAEEVAEIMPDLVVFKNHEPDSVKYHEMPAILLLEIQKLVKRVELLELALKEKV